jgi:hypothetical protein
MCNTCRGTRLLLELRVAALQRELAAARAVVRNVLTAWDADASRGMTLGTSIHLHTEMMALRRWWEESR